MTKYGSSTDNLPGISFCSDRKSIPSSLEEAAPKPIANQFMNPLTFARNHPHLTGLHVIAHTLLGFLAWLNPYLAFSLAPHWMILYLIMAQLYGLSAATWADRRASGKNKTPAKGVIRGVQIATVGWIVFAVLCWVVKFGVEAYTGEKMVAKS